MKKLFVLFTLLAAPVFADAPVVKDVSVFQQGRDLQFHVTLRHGDTGWDHYADGWEVRNATGQVLGHRTLSHPHVNEQPFTRSLRISNVPRDLDRVWVFARDNLGDWSIAGFEVELP